MRIRRRRGCDPGHDLLVDVATVRETQLADHARVLELVRAAFSDATRDGHEEVDIVDATWRLGSTVRPIDLVAVVDGEVVGHVLGASGDLSGQPALAVAPLAVAPDHQGRGVGTALMQELLAIAERAEWAMVLLLGNPAYYQRFGFEAAGTHGIVYPPVGPDSPHFLIRPLPTHDGSCRGTFRYCWEQP
jgi:putative acetyltransferase